MAIDPDQIEKHFKSLETPPPPAEVRERVLRSVLAAESHGFVPGMLLALAASALIGVLYFTFGSERRLPQPSRTALFAADDEENEGPKTHDFLNEGYKVKVLGAPQFQHDFAVLTAAFSPDGKIIVTGASDGAVRFWEVATGTEIRSFRAHASDVTTICFYPDGRKIATSGDHDVKVWSMEGKELMNLAWKGNGGEEQEGDGDDEENDEAEDEGGEVVRMAISPDGKKIAAGDDNTQLMLWDAETGKRVLEFDLGDDYSITDVVFSPDGKSLLTPLDDNAVFMWSVETGEKISSMQGLPEMLTSAAFSPDGSTIALGGEDGPIRIWDAASGLELKVFNRDAEEAALSVSYSPDGKQLLSSGADYSVTLWDVEKGELVRSFSGHWAEVYCAAFAPNGKTVLSAGMDGTLRIWDVNTGEDLARRKRAGSETVTPSVGEGEESGTGGLLMSPDRKKFLCIGGGHTGSSLRDLETGKVWPVLSREVADFFYCAAFNAGGKALLLCDENQRNRLYDLQTGKEMEAFKAPAGRLLSAAFSPDGKHLLACYEQRHSLILLDAVDGHEIRALESRGPLAYMEYSPDGKAILLLKGDAKLCILDAESGKPAREWQADPKSVASAHFSPDGLKIVSTGVKSVASLWEVATGKPVAVLDGKDNSFFAAVFSGDGKRVLTGGYSKTVQFWNLETGKEALAIRNRVFKNKDSEGTVVVDMIATPDFSTFVTVNPNGVICLYRKS